MAAKSKLHARSVSVLSMNRTPSFEMGAAKIHSYKIKMQINPDNSMEGGAELELESESSCLFAEAHFSSLLCLFITTVEDGFCVRFLGQ